MNCSRVFRYSMLVVLVSAVSACSSKPPASPAKPPATPEQVRAEAERAAQFGDHARALAGWQALLEKKPDDLVALRGIGDVYLAAGQAALALPVYEKLLSLNAADIDAQEGRGLALVALGRSEEAREQIAQVLTSSRARWRSLNAMGLLLDMDGKPDSAQQHYREALVLQPGNPLVLNNLGYSRMMMQDYVWAERFFSEGLRAQPDGKHLHANLVLAIAWQGEYDRALSEATRQQPKEEALNNVGYIALLRKDYKAAIRYFEQAIEVSPRWYPRAAANLERARKESEAVTAQASPSTP